MARDRRAYGVGLAPQALIVDAGPPADPVLRLPAMKRMIDGRRRRRIADTHLAEHEQVGLGGERLHAERHRRRATFFVECGFLGHVAGRLLQGQFVHFERQIEGLADLIDRRAASLEIRHHRLRNRRRKGRDPLRDDAMIASEDRDQRPIHMRPRRSLPGRHPLGNLLEPAERTRGLRQLPLALASRRTGCFVGFWHFSHEVADVVERAACVH